jgi:hypothetical protein
MTVTNISLFFVISLALAYAALRFRRSASRFAPVDGIPGFRAGIGFTALDGMQSVSLLLENESLERIWVEKIEISLSDLSAKDQTADAPCREILRILQTVGAHDLLPISLAGVIYRAAGGPQREYSCMLSAILHFRIDENWFERKLETYRVRMVGLTAASVRRTRTPIPESSPAKEPQSVAVVAARFK